MTSLPPFESFVARFRGVAAAHRRRPALRSEAESGAEMMTFGELDERSDALAEALHARRVGRETIVGLAADRSTDAIVGLLGIWKAGGAYLPIDPALPRERMRFTLRDARATILVAAGPSELGALPDVEVVRPDHPRAAQRTALPDLGERDLAYVIYTSGSSGKPKGVLIEHRSLPALWQGLRAHLPELPLDQRTATINAPLSFDASLQQLVLLLDAYTLHIVPGHCRTDPGAFLDLMTAGRISVLDCTPTHLNALLASGLLARPFPSILLVGGEPISTRAWQAIASSDKIAFNVYGPTETTVDATIQRIDASSAEVTVGRALHPAIRVRVLDDRLLPVPPGAVGELCIGGPGVGRGYLDRPELTRERFVVDPSDPEAGALYRTGDLARELPGGSIVLVGRRDDQVKIRGYRIELEEIRTALASIPGVRGAAVLAVESALGENRLAAVVAPADLDIAQIRDRLRDELPDYMIPAELRALEALPVLASGKLDRAALLRQLQAPAAVAPDEPFTARELPIVQVWRSLLNLPVVSRTDNFFQSGGHSLLATQLIERLKVEHRLHVPLAALFLDPTIAGIARAASSEPPPADCITVLNHGREDAIVLCFHPLGGELLAYRPLVALLGLSATVYGVQSRALRDPGTELASAEDMVRHYAAQIAALRCPSAPHLVGWSLGGLLAIQVAHRLEAAGLPVASVELWDVARAGRSPGRPDMEIFLALRVAMGAVFGAALDTLSADEQRALTDGFVAAGATASERMGWLLDWATKEGIPIGGVNRSLAERRLALCLRHSALFSTPAFPTVAAPLHVVWARDSVDAHAGTLTGWETFSTGPTTVEVIAGDHDSIVREPAIRLTARALRERLRSSRDSA
ncbi:MAG TPA: amino acid adenylation domain-containing protein [Kofleriaceae bacterium]|nr:amino acid adenylation domain-containing protein [Kofleriaceae bacterium]